MRAILLVLGLTSCCIPLGGPADEPPPIATPERSPAPDPAAPAFQIPAPVAPAPAEDPLEMQGRKVAEYTRHCLNEFSGPVQGARARYLAWVDPEAGPTGRERAIALGIHAVRSDPALCRQAVVRAGAMAPPMAETEQAAAAFAQAVETLAPVVNEANRYYAAQRFRDDGAAAGQALHPRLMSGFAAYVAAEAELRRLVEGTQDAVRSARLARMENQPAQRSRFLMERTMAQALAVMRLVGGITLEDSRLTCPDPAGFVAAVEALDVGVEELRSHQSAPPDVAPEGIGDVIEEAGSVAREALALMRRIRDAERLSTFDIASLEHGMGSGTPRRFEDTYNRLISAYNRVDR